jgi:site-specific DNA-methyltransferase (adenine-specific)/site-specific DNA-methyltransferase (cytosine-N4-specific)
MSSIFPGDCLKVLPTLEAASVNLVMTSPPYADLRKHSYGGIPVQHYVGWFLPIVDELWRVLKPDGSLILNLCPHTDNGQEAEYVDDLKYHLRRKGWFLLDTYCWVKTNGIPGNVAYRLRNGWEPLFHFAKRPNPAFYPEQVKQPAKQSSIDRANRLRGRDFETRTSDTGSGFSWNMSKLTRSYRTTGSGFNFVDTVESIHDADGMVLPCNVIESACETRNLHRLYGDPFDIFHEDRKASAPFPEKIPAFFIDLLTRRGDTVLDPFAGSGTTGKVAQDKGRNFILIEKEPSNIRLIHNRLNAVCRRQ